MKPKDNKRGTNGSEKRKFDQDRGNTTNGVVQGRNLIRGKMRVTKGGNKLKRLRAGPVQNCRSGSRRPQKT